MAEKVVIGNAELWHGDCRGASAYDAAQLDEVPYLIKATPAVWKDMIYVGARDGYMYAIGQKDS